MLVAVMAVLGPYMGFPMACMEVIAGKFEMEIDVRFSGQGTGDPFKCNTPYT